MRLFLFLFLFISSNLFAHPHVFIDNRPTIVFDEKGLKEIKISWEFDEMFGQGIILELDLNGNGKFEKKEIEIVKKEMFDNLKQYNYQTFVYLNNKLIKLEEVSGFQAEIKNDKLFYNFTLPCRVDAKDEFQEVVVMFIDPTNYTRIYTKKEDISFGPLAALNAQTSIGKRNMPKISFAVPAATIKFKKK